MKKKVLALLLIVALVASLCVAFTACNNDQDEFKIGMICLHDQNSTYDANFINAMKEVQKELGLSDSQVIIVTGIPEDQTAYDTAANLVDQGCDFIFADSFGHEPFILQAAKDYPSVQFAHATGTRAHTEKLANFQDAFASIYEGRYMVGVAAGMKLVELYGDAATGEVSDTNAHIGYVGAWPYAEVISGYTSFFLGVKSIVPNVTMEVQYTNSWYDETAEKAAAVSLIGKGAKLISQHADSMGAPTACKEAGIPNVTYNISTEDSCSGTFIAATRINWAPYLKQAIQKVQAGEFLTGDYTGTIATGSVEVIGIGAAAADGTAAKLAEIKAAFEAGTLKVFDTDTFTVGGQKLTTYKADVDDMGDYVPETEVVSDGIFKESFFRSAPYFDIIIDGITVPSK